MDVPVVMPDDSVWVGTGSPSATHCGGRGHGFPLDALFIDHISHPSHANTHGDPASVIPAQAGIQCLCAAFAIAPRSRSLDELKAQFSNPSILRDGWVVFNIAGNKYRLVAWINYPYRIVYIRFFGTHKQYDGIDAQII